MLHAKERLSLPKVSRRDFLKLAAAYAGYESLLFAGLLKESQHIDVHHYVYHDTTLPREWDGTILVQISDLHIGERGLDPVNPDSVQVLAAQIQDYLNILKADPDKTFLFDTGDAVSVFARSGVATRIDDLEESLGYLSQIKVTHKFAVEGNHDKAHSNRASIVLAYRSAGFVYADPVESGNVLQFLEIPSVPFTLLVAPDYTTRKNDWYESQSAKDFLTVLESLPPEQLTVMLTHNPSVVDVWREGKVTEILRKKKAIVLAGHTHGGQLNSMSPLQRAAMSLGREVKNYDSQLIKGIHTVGTSIVNVNTGIGYSKGVRTLPPSFDVFELRRGEASSLKL